MKTMTGFLAALCALAVTIAPLGAQVSFAAQVTYVAGAQPEMSAIWDFNADGDFDVAVTSDAPDKITLHSNNGAGVLTLTQTIPMQNGSSPHFVVAGDFDGDFDVDLAVTLKNANAVTIVFNNGGVFTPSGILLPVGTNPRSLVAVNIDGDADMDLIASNRDSNTISVLRNNGNGTFQPAVNVAVGQDPRHLAVGDLDADGDLDLVVANNNSNSISVLTNNGTGTFTVTTTLSTGTFDSEGIVLADVDGDHDLDIAATGHEGTNALNVVLVFLKQGTAFGGFVSYPIGGQGPDFIAANDLDLDGDYDLTTVNKDSNNLSVLANNGLGAFAAAVLIPIGSSPEHVITGDLDGDQIPDLVATNSGGNTFSVLRNLAPNGTLSMLSPPVIGTPAAVQISSPNDPGDFYVCAFAFGNLPGITLTDRRHVPLNYDLLLELSLTPNNGFFANSTGFLAPDGTGIVYMYIPPTPALIGLSIYATCAILNPSASDGLEQTFGSLQITFQ